MFKKKSLGQNFLHDRTYLDLIVKTAGIQKGENILEVGPGEGALTEMLLAADGRVLAVEKDRRLIPILQEKFVGKSFKVIEADVLRLDISSHYKDAEMYKIVANIPYYITGAFLKQFLTAAHQPSSMTLLVQKEVALRIAREKKESILSLSVKAYGEPHYIKSVPAGAFSPPPKVDSAILQISNISRQNFASPEHEERFFALVRAGFAQKRKKLSRNLEALLGADYSTILQNGGIEPDTRAEDVALAQWLELSRV